MALLSGSLGFDKSKQRSGSTSNSGASSSSQNSSNTASRSFQDIFGPQPGALAQLFGGAGNTFGSGNLSQVAGFDPFQTQGQGLAANFATGQAGDSFSNANSALNFALGGPQSFVNSPVLQNSINSAVRPLLQQFNEGTLQGIDDGAIAAGGFGDTGNQIERGIARRGLQDTIGDVATNLTANAFNQGVGAQGNALGRVGDVANLGLFGSNILRDIGAERQGQRQSLLDNPFNNLARLQGLLGPAITLSGSDSRGNSFGSSLANSTSSSSSFGKGDSFGVKAGGGIL